MALTLQLDGSTVNATFSSNGTTSLGEAVFSYTIAAGDSAASINYAGTDSLAFVGQGTFVDFSGNAGVLTLPDPASALTANTTISIDEVLPTITSQKAGLGGTSVVIGFSEVVSGSPAASDFTVTVDGTENAVTNFALAENGLSATLTVTNAFAADTTLLLSYTQGTNKITDASGGALVSTSSALTISTAGPTVSSVSSTAADATYGIDDVIPIQVTFSEPVVVQGSPTLALETGSSDGSAVYASGSGTDTLTFNYTVADSHVSSDLEYKATASLELPTGTGSTIRNLVNADATLTLASPGATNSISDNQTIVIDGVRPTFDTYAANAGTTTLTITTSEAVSGTPDGGDFTVTNAAGVTNTVTAATVASDGGSIALTLTDIIPNDASLTVTYAKNSDTAKQITGTSDGNSVSSVGSGQSVTVTNDVSAPTVSSVSTSASDATYGIGDVIPILIQFNEVVNVAGTPTLELETGTLDATAVYASGTGTDTLTFNYTVLSTHVAADLDYKATTSLALPTNSDTIRDNLSTNATLTLATPGATNSIADNQAIVIDGVRPTFTGFTANAGTTTITIAADEVLTGAPDATDFTVQSAAGVGNTVTAATLASDGQSIALTLTNIIQNDADLNVTYAQSSTESKKLKDPVGNDLVSVTTGQSVTVTNDVSAPTVSSVSTSASDATYGIGDVIPILIQFNEVVNVQGTPTIELETGTLDATAVYASGTGTDTLTFNYTVLSTHVAADLDYKATTSLALPTSSDTIRDNLATNATLTLATPGQSNSISDNQAIVIDGVRPTFTGLRQMPVQPRLPLLQMKC